MPTAYASILRRPHVLAPLVASMIGRLPIAATGLALVFLVRSETGSFASAGVVDAAFGIGFAAAMPFMGRMVDRLGQPRGLAAAAPANAIALVGIVLAARG